MKRIVILVDFQRFHTSDNNKCLVYGKTKHFIRGEHWPFANTAGFTVFRCVVGYTEGSKLFGFAERKMSRGDKR